MIKLGKKLALATLLITGVIGSANALVLDSFDYTLPGGSVGGVEINLSDSVVGLPNASQLVKDINPFLADVNYNLDLTNGIGASAKTFLGDLSWNNESTHSTAGASLSELTLTYSQLDGGQPFPLNLYTGWSNAFYFDVFYSDNSFDVNVEVEDTNGNLAVNSFSRTGQVNNITESIAYGNFSNFGSTNFASVKNITITLASTEGAVDLTLTELGLTVVPEPSSIAIFGLALVGFAFSSKRKFK